MLRVKSELILLLLYTCISALIQRGGEEGVTASFYIPWQTHYRSQRANAQFVMEYYS